MGSGLDPSEENLAPLQEARHREKISGWSLPPMATPTVSASSITPDGARSFSPITSSAAWSSITCSETRGLKLGASRSVATTHLMDAVGKLHNVKVYETPVGFKYIGPLLRAGKIIIGGEESAGMTIHGHLPEKDGILACLLVAEMIAASGTSLMDQLRDLFKRVGGEYWPVRMNLHLPDETQKALPDRLRENFNDFAGHRVAKTDRTDGLKLIFDDGSWILMRPSGTEPVARIYHAEASTQAAAEKLAEDAKAWITK